MQDETLTCTNQMKWFALSVILIRSEFFKLLLLGVLSYTIWVLNKFETFAMNMENITIRTRITRVDFDILIIDNTTMIFILMDFPVHYFTQPCYYAQFSLRILISRHAKIEKTDTTDSWAGFSTKNDFEWQLKFKGSHG